jgi:hypothetical protein
MKEERNKEKKGGGKRERKKENIYLPSLMMKVPDHVYVLG